STNRKLPLHPVASMQPRACCLRSHWPRVLYASSLPGSAGGGITPNPGKKMTECGGSGLSGPFVGSRCPLPETKLAPSGDRISQVIDACCAKPTLAWMATQACNISSGANTAEAALPSTATTTKCNAPTGLAESARFLALFALNAALPLSQSGRLPQLAGHDMKARTVVGIIVGFLSWWALFLVTIVVIALLWPAFAKAGRAASTANDYSALTTSMLALLLATYVYINGLAGWIAARVAGRRTAMWFAVTPIFAYAAFQHLHMLWHA